MKRDALKDTIEAETQAIGQAVSGLRTHVNLGRSLGPAPLVGLLIGAGIGWLGSGKAKSPQAVPDAAVAAWENEGGAVLAIPGAPLATDARLGRGIAAFALGIAAALLLPRTRREDAIFGKSGGWARRQLAQGAEGAVALGGQVARRLGDDLISEMQKDAETKIDAASRAVVDASDAIIAQIKAAGAQR